MLDHFIKKGIQAPCTERIPSFPLLSNPPIYLIGKDPLSELLTS
ncbi:hypothetical protein Patl1_12971 [Pistacia atlantica]|uniref:Uncharacterized protein n=1 Tax=Pistacia atlantica TaxID=434234 RepID=A0ACC1AWT4_9ROSI|nr:hypothetical protein Patl1_12971 [Pistacia atlantica]